jgi:hypothetical protein
VTSPPPGVSLTLLAASLLAIASVARRHPTGSPARGRGLPVGWAEDGAPLYKPRGRKRHEHRGRVVNPRIRLPTPPGPWIDDERCKVCGETYTAHRSGVSFGQARAQLDNAWPKEQGARFISLGSVLFKMREIKLVSWYLRHAECGFEWEMQQHSRKKGPHRGQRQEGWEPDPQYIPPSPQSEIPF